MTAKPRASVMVSLFLVLCLKQLSVAQTTSFSDINEDELFSDTVTVVEDTGQVSRDSVPFKNQSEKTVGFSGEVTTAVSFGLPRDLTDSANNLRESLTTFAVANLMLDVRLANGIKTFGNLETQYSSSGNTNLLVNLRELFVDGNINYHVYLRAGKQVLQWGRCYLFNPTDLINVEKKLFVQKIGYREGTYGLRIHVPFGTIMNLYGFLDTRAARSIDEMAGAAKVEVLAGSTEMAFSLWGKRAWEPVYAFDLSTRLGQFNIAGEASISYGDNYDRISVVNDTIETTRMDDAWMPRVALSVSRFIKVQGIPDRLMIIAEGYYNHAGYTDNGFADKREYAFRKPLQFSDSAGASLSIASGTKRMFLESNSLYELNNYSKYYAALFTQFSRFITSEMTLTCNAIGNISQKSALVTAGLNYRSINDFFVDVLCMALLGPKDTEYTYTGGAMTVRLSAGLVF